jgi:hypothetical protein
MATYQISHACGHVVTHRIYGEVEGREAKVDWLSRNDCPACRAAQKEAEEKAKVKQVSEGLPPLTGTEKQIAWAEKIRVAVYASGLEFFSRLSKDKRDEPESKLRYYISAATSAHWWIEHRATLENIPSHILLGGYSKQDYSRSIKP